MTAELWQAENGSVRLRTQRFSAVLDPLHPGSGLSQLTIGKLPLPGVSILAVELTNGESQDAAAPRPEYYVRGGDLVATYPETAAQPWRAQVYWRATVHRADDVIAAIELVASVQTSLLDSRPEIITRSEVAAGEMLQLADPAGAKFTRILPQSDHDESLTRLVLPHCYLFRLPSVDVSYVEIVHPVDAHHSTYENLSHGSQGRIELRHQLFSQRLEKGVILRARVLGVLVDRQRDRAIAARQYTEFVNSELPLTT